MGKKWLLYSLKPPTEISCKDETLNPRAKVRNFFDVTRRKEQKRYIAKAIGVSTSTINDRLTSKVWIRELSGKDVASLALKAIETLQPIKDLIHTITADNGKEFAKHQEIAEKLEISFYFCKPYHSWERGANENNTYPKERTSVR